MGRLARTYNSWLELILGLALLLFFKKVPMLLRLCIFFNICVLIMISAIIIQIVRYISSCYSVVDGLQLDVSVTAEAVELDRQSMHIVVCISFAGSHTLQAGKLNLYKVVPVFSVGW